MSESIPCRLLEWDSEFFGFRIARVDGGRLTTKKMRDILAWCEENFIECLYFLADSDHMDTLRLAERHQFSLVDIRVELQRSISGPLAHATLSSTEAFQTRRFLPGDIPSLKEIARQSITGSRFFSDPCFSKDASHSLYEAWVEKSCQGYADQVLVSAGINQKNDPVSGFITCHLPTADSGGTIGLLGTAVDFQGQGVGRALVNAALDWFGANGVGDVKVVTQGQNIKAQRLYQSSGFITHTQKLWYHKWFAACDVALRH